MSSGRITGGFGEKPRTPRFTPQGVAWPTDVSEGIVQTLLSSAGSRGVTSAPVAKKYAGQVAAGSARVVSGGSAKYADIASKIVSGVDPLVYSKDVLEMYPGGRSGLVGEIGDVLYLFTSGDGDGGTSRLSQVQSGFEQSADLVGRNKLAETQSQIEYLTGLSNQMARELPYGEQWFLETAEANIKAKYGTGAQMSKSQYDGLEIAERQRLRNIAWATETAMNDYLAQVSKLQGFMNGFGPAPSAIVTKLFADLSAEIDKILKEFAAAQSILDAKYASEQAAAQSAANSNYCKEQNAAMNNYIRMSKEFNDAVKAALADFTATSAAFLNKVGV